MLLIKYLGHQLISSFTLVPSAWVYTWKICYQKIINVPNGINVDFSVQMVNNYGSGRLSNVVSTIPHKKPTITSTTVTYYGSIPTTQNYNIKIDIDISENVGSVIQLIEIVDELNNIATSNLFYNPINNTSGTPFTKNNDTSYSCFIELENGKIYKLKCRMENDIGYSNYFQHNNGATFIYFDNNVSNSIITAIENNNNVNQDNYKNTGNVFNAISMSLGLNPPKDQAFIDNIIANYNTNSGLTQDVAFLELTKLFRNDLNNPSLFDTAEKQQMFINALSTVYDNTTIPANSDLYSSSNYFSSVVPGTRLDVPTRIVAPIYSSTGGTIVRDLFGGNQAYITMIATKIFNANEAVFFLIPNGGELIITDGNNNNVRLFKYDGIVYSYDDINDISIQLQTSSSFSIQLGNIILTLKALGSSAWDITNLTNGLCIHPDMIVDELEKPISTIKSHSFDSTYVATLKLGYSDIFVKFPTNSLGINSPSQELLITPEHPILYNGVEIKAKDFIGKNGISYQKTERKLPIYALSYTTRKSVKIHNVDVMQWKQTDFEDYCKQKNYIYDQHLGLLKC